MVVPLVRHLTVLLEYIDLISGPANLNNLARLSTSQNTMYCGGEPEHYIHNVTHVSFNCA